MLNNAIAAILIVYMMALQLVVFVALIGTKLLPGLSLWKVTSNFIQDEMNWIKTQIETEGD